MRKIFFVLLVIMAAVVPFAHAAHGLEAAMSSIRSPEDIARFFSQEFTCTMTFPDRAHSPEETIQAQSGDCSTIASIGPQTYVKTGSSEIAAAKSYRGSELMASLDPRMSTGL